MALDRPPIPPGETETTLSEAAQAAVSGAAATLAAVANRREARRRGKHRGVREDAPALQAAGSASIERVMGKAIEGNDLGGFSAALNLPGGPGIANAWRRNVGKGNMVPLSITFMGTHKMDWLRTLLEASDFHGLRHGIADALAKGCVDQGEVDLAAEIYAHAADMYAPVGQLAPGLDLFGWLDLSWKGLAAPADGRRRDALSYAVAAGSPKLVAMLGEICFAPFKVNGDGENDPEGTLRAACEYALQAFRANGDAVFKDCADILKPLMAKATMQSMMRDAARARQAVKAPNLEAEPASPERLPPQAPELECASKPGDLLPSSEESVKLMMQEMLWLRGEVDRLNAKVLAFEQAPAQGSLASKVARRRQEGQADPAQPEKSLGISNGRR